MVGRIDLVTDKGLAQNNENKTTKPLFFISQRDKKGPITLPFRDQQTSTQFIKRTVKEQRCQGCMSKDGCGDKMATVVHAIEVLPVVTVLSPLATSSTNDFGYEVLFVSRIWKL